MNEIAIKEPDTKEVEAQGANLLKRATDLVVKDDVSFQMAGEIMLDAKKCQKAVEWLYAESISMAHKLHKSLCAKSNLLSAPAISAELTAKRKMGTYQQEIERDRRAEAERLQRQAEAQAEAERIAKAQDQMDKGDLAGCEKTLEAPSAPVVVRVETPEPPKMAGVSFRDEVKFEITDPDAVPRNLCCPDEKKIRNFVKAMGAATVVPGVRIWIEKVVSGRAA